MGLPSTTDTPVKTRLLISLERGTLMALIHTSRTAGRTGRPHFVPGGLACAASARRVLLAPTLFPLSMTPKRVYAPATPVQRLTPSPA